MASDDSLDDVRQTLAELQTRLATLEDRLSILMPPVPRAANAPRTMPPIPPPLPREIPISPPVTPLRVEPIHLEKQESRDLESFIGQHWTAWIGGIVFILGILFFLKYAWDQGWIQPTPTMRIVSVIVVGILFNLGGEWAFRKKIATQGAVLHGVGIATMMAALYAAYAAFDPPQRVLSANEAGIGILIVALAAVFLSLHINTVAVAVIAMLGAYAAPAILEPEIGNSLELMFFLLAIAVMGLLLSCLKSTWSALRVIVMFGTYITLLWWGSDIARGPAYTIFAMTWLIVFHVLILGEIIFSSRESSRPHDRIAIISLLGAGMAFGIAANFLQFERTSKPLGWVAIGGAILQLSTIFLTRYRPLRISLLLQGLALATLAVPLLVNESAVTPAWLTMAAALAILAWKLKFPAVRIAAIALLVLAIARQFSRAPSFIFRYGYGIDALAPIHHLPWLGWTSVGAILAHAIACLNADRPKSVSPSDAASKNPDIAGNIIAVFGTMTLVSAACMVTNEIQSILAALAIASGLVLLSKFSRRVGYLPQAIFLAGFISLAWFFALGLIPTTDAWDTASPVLPPIFNSIALAGMWLVAFWMCVALRQRSHPQEFFAATIVAATLLLATLNFEACRAVDWFGTPQWGEPAIVKQVLTSVLWSIAGFIGIAIGFRYRNASLRYAALTLLGITLLKILLVDMAQVQTIWRILSFLATGLLLLCVSFLYQRHQKSREAVSVIV